MRRGVCETLALMGKRVSSQVEGSANRHHRCVLGQCVAFTSSPSTATEAALHSQHDSYLSDVDKSLTMAYREQYHEEQLSSDTATSERDVQAKTLRDDLIDTCKGVEESVVKLRRINELFFMASDSQLPLSSGIQASMVYMLGFVRFPNKNVGFERHELVWKMYQHAKDVDKNMHIDIIKLTMMALAKCPPKFRNASLFYKGMELVKDMRENFQFQSVTLGYFFRICSSCQQIEAKRGGQGDEAVSYMGAALALHNEYVRTEYFLQHTLYYSYLLNGLCKAARIDDALYVINKFEKVPMNNLLATTCVDVCANSEEPASAFSMYKVLFSKQWSALAPTREVYSCLLFAAARNPGGMQVDEIQYICSEMAAKGVRTDSADFLNRLCISLFAVKRAHLGIDLYKSMLQRDIEVWDITKDAVPYDEEGFTMLGQDTPIQEDVPIRSTDTASDVTARFDELPSDAPTWTDNEAITIKGVFEPDELRNEHSLAGLPQDAPVFTEPRKIKVRKTIRQTRHVDSLEEKRRREASQRALTHARTLPPPEVTPDSDEPRDDSAGYDVGQLLGL